VVVAAATVVLAGVVRLLCARGDLWLDEVWTLALLNTLVSPLQIVTRLTHDNNHVLNSLFAWWLRGLEHDWLLRLPSVIAGTAGVAVAASFLGLDDGPGVRDPSRPGVRAALAALLMGASYLMVHYESEARGYALALGIGLFSPWAFLRARASPGSRLAIVHWVAVSLALLGHAVAIHLFAATLAWSLVRFRRDGLGVPSVVTAAVWWHGVPAAVTAAFYFGFLGRLSIGGGPQVPLMDVLAGVVAYTFGFPLSLGAFALVALGALIVVGGLIVLHRMGSDQWVFYATGILVSPIAALAVQPGDLHFERYFFVSAALALLLLARMLGALAVRVPLAAGAAVVLFLAGQAPRIQRLVVDGRGHYAEAVTYMVAHTPSRPVRVASDHDFRNGLVISYQASRLRLGKDQLDYLAAQELARSGADWYVVHRPGDDPAPPPVFTDPGGRAYRLETSFPSAPLSGYRWFLYRREGTTPRT
jgi:hypothetical protein